MSSKFHERSSAYTVHDVPENQRPRELAKRHGTSGVSDVVLLSILLGKGTAGLNVIDLASSILDKYGSLTALADASEKELCEFNGIGPVKAQLIRSALELARRMAAENRDTGEEYDTPAKIAELFRGEVPTLTQEVFWVICLDARHRLMGQPEVVTTGLADATLVHPRELFTKAIRRSCSSVVVAHNHPSGDPSPSPQDIKITRQLVEAGKILGIELLDHVVIGKPGAVPHGTWYYSIRESGLVPF